MAQFVDVAPPSPESPRLARLRRDLEAGESDALAAFWAEVRERGTPLVEPIAGDPEGRSLLTFVWCGDESTKSVTLSALSWPPGDKAAKALRRLASTDLWYGATYVIRPGHRTTYAFIVDDPEPDRNTRNAHACPDPLNRHPLNLEVDDTHPEFVSFLGPAWTLSTVVASTASERRPRAPSGRLELHRFTSDLLGNDRQIAIYTPHGADNAVDRCLLVVLDGALARIDRRYSDVLDRLFASGRIPPLIAVLVDSIHHIDVRPREMKFNDAFADFLACELVPWVASRYHISADPRRRVVSGTSLGGLAAAFAALRHPSAFGNVLAQSGSFQVSAPGEGEPEGLARMVVSLPTTPIRFALDAGRLEGLIAGTTVRDDHPADIVSATRHLRDLLRAKGYEVFHREFEGAHDFGGWAITFEDGLLDLIGTP